METFELRGRDITKDRQIRVGEDLQLFNSLGLVKKVNEDYVLVVRQKDSLLFIIVDGHWGFESSEIILELIKKGLPTILDSREVAVELFQRFEKKIFEEMGFKGMDQEKDLTSESSVAIVIIEDDELIAVGYGDCRVHLINEEITSLVKPKETWLGAFSHLGLRNRTSVERSLDFTKTVIKPGDILLLSTDGLQECIYEKMTISDQRILEISIRNSDLEGFCNGLAVESVKYGAEDNMAYIGYKHK